jgi:hypothetical protein
MPLEQASGRDAERFRKGISALEVQGKTGRSANAK